MRKVNWITLHCTGAAATQTLESIQAHWRSLGWRNPGYHYLITIDGTVHVLAPHSQVTNGVAGHNANAIHVAYTGGVDSFGRIADTRTTAQRNAMAKLVNELAAQYPTSAILGHRDFSPDKNRNGRIEEHEWIKACPSFSVKAWLQEIGFKNKGEKVLKVTAARLNIRSGPGVNHPLAGAVLPVDALVQVISQCGEWSYVQVQATKQLGWVSSTHLKSY